MSDAPLVLLHGWGLHAGAWDDVRDALAARRPVLAPDLPGHGGTHAPAAFDDAVAQVAAGIPDGAIVCGWSLGGLVAQRLAVAHPGKASRVVLVSTTPCFVAQPDWDTAMKPRTLETFADGLHRDRERTLRDFVHLNALHGAHGREAVRVFMRRLAQREAPALAALEASLGWLRDTDLRAQAARIVQPALVIHGARDALAPVEAGRWLSSALPDARLDEIADAAHLPFFTHRDRFVHAVEAFLG